MNKREMPETISLNEKVLSLLTQFPVNDHFQIGIYQGTLSQFDMLIRYKQLINCEWTRARTPKHIHWAVDILIIHAADCVTLLLPLWRKAQVHARVRDED